MPVAKLPPNAGEHRFDSDKRRARERVRSKFERDQAIAKKAAQKRAAAAKKGAEGPKQSKPGGYSIARPKADTKKKRRV